MHIDALVLCLHICLCTQMYDWFQWKLEELLLFL